MAECTHAVANLVTAGGATCDCGAVFIPDNLYVMQQAIVDQEQAARRDEQVR